MSSSAPKSTYSQGYTPSVIASHQQRTVHNSAAFLLPHLAPHFSLLDIGCGPGTITVGFADVLSRGRVTGIDLSQDVIETASKLIGDRQNLKFEVGDVLDGLKYPDGSFDVIYTHQTIDHIPYPIKAITEMRRILNPGGLLACREATHLHWWPLTPGLELFNTMMHKLMGSYGAPGLNRGALHAFVRQAGFQKERMVVGAGTTVFTTEEERRWWAGVHVGRLRDGGVGEKCKELGTLDEKGVEEVCRALEEWGEAEDGWYCAVQSEVLAWK